MTDEIMTDKEAMMMLESMRDQRLSVQVLSDLLLKASEAKTTLATLKTQKEEIEASIANIAVNHKAEVDKYEKFKVSLAKDTQEVADAKAKLQQEYNKAVEKTRLANEALAQVETKAADRSFALDKEIAAKTTQLESLQATLKALAGKASALAA